MLFLLLVHLPFPVSFTERPSPVLSAALVVLFPYSMR